MFRVLVLCIILSCAIIAHSDIIKPSVQLKPAVQRRPLAVLSSSEAVQPTKSNTIVRTSNNPSIVYSSLFALSTVVVGLTTAQSVLLCKKVISILDTRLTTVIPHLAPLLGSAVVCLCYAVDSNLSVNPFTLPLVVNKRSRSNSAKSGRRLATDFVRFESHKMKGGKSFSILRQLMRILATLIVLGTGCSLGLTAASAEIGMTMAHLCGYFLPIVNREPTDSQLSSSADTTADLPLSSELIQRNVQYRVLLLLAGAAAGVAANFNAPLTGLFYALEIGSQLQSVTNYQNILQQSEGKSDLGGRSSGSTASGGLRWPETLGAVGTAVLVSVMFMRFALPSSARPMLSCLPGSSGCVSYIDYISSPLQLLTPYGVTDWLYIGTVGVMGGLLAMLVTSLRGIFSQLAARLLPAPYFRPLLAGLFCFRFGLSNRVSFLQMNSLFNNNLAVVVNSGASVKMLFSKVLSFVMCSSSGLIGGHMAPSLFIGSTLGAALNHLTPQSTLVDGSSSVTPSLSVMLGATAFISAFFRAPLTAVFLIIELTHSHYQRVLAPLLVTSLVAFVVIKTACL